MSEETDAEKAYLKWRNSLPESHLKMYSIMPNTFSEDAFAAGRESVINKHSKGFKAWIDKDPEMTALEAHWAREGWMNSTIFTADQYLEAKEETDKEIKDLKEELMYACNFIGRFMCEPGDESFLAMIEIRKKFKLEGT